MRIHWLRIKKNNFKPVTFPCWKCYRRFCWKSRCNDHAANCQIGRGYSNRRGTPSLDFVLTSTAVVDSVKVYAYNFPEGFIDIDMIDTLLYVNAAKLILAELQRQSIKVNIVLTLNFYKAAEPNEITRPSIFFSERTAFILPSDNNTRFTSWIITSDNTELQAENRGFSATRQWLVHSRPCQIRAGDNTNGLLQNHWFIHRTSGQIKE